MLQGFISLHRQIMEHWLYRSQKFNKCHAWIDLVLSAYHKDVKHLIGNNIEHIKRGQFITSELKLMQKWGWSKTKVRNFLALLEKDGMIIKDSDHQKTRITICNYDKFQLNSVSIRPQKNISETPREQEKNTNNNDNTFNNVINNVDIINDFNAICGNEFGIIATHQLSKNRELALKTASTFLANNNITFHKYFQLCLTDVFLTGKKDSNFKATLDYILKIETIERVLNLNSNALNASNIDETISNNELMSTIISTSKEVTQVTKKMLIDTIEKAYELGFTNEEIYSSINSNTKYLISRIQKIRQFISEGINHE